MSSEPTTVPKKPERSFYRRTARKKTGPDDLYEKLRRQQQAVAYTNVIRSTMR